MLVSVVVPTHNAEKTIRGCLESIRHQTHAHIEVLVVDDLSSDRTSEIGLSYGTVVEAKSSMTRARLIGALRAKGEFVLNLDADQSLEPFAIERAVADGHSCVALGERSVPGGWISLVNSADQLVTSKNWKTNLGVIAGAIRPRFYRREPLVRALQSIPGQILDVRPCPFSEDSLILVNSGFKTSDVGFVPNAITHRDETSIRFYVRKWVRYGQSARTYRGTKYEVLVHQRGGRSGSALDVLATLPSRMLRGIPFFIGYSSG